MANDSTWSSFGSLSGRSGSLLSTFQEALSGPHSPPHLRRQLQDAAPDAGLRGIQLGGGYPLAEREGEKVEKVLRDGKLGIDERPRARAWEPDARSETRIAQQPRLHEVRLRDA